MRAVADAEKKPKDEKTEKTTASEGEASSADERDDDDAEASDAKPKKAVAKGEGDADEDGEPSEEAAEGDEAGAEAASDEAAAEDAEEPIKENRRERRRKKKRPDGEGRDRNARVRDQLLKKKIEAEKPLDPLTTGEMVDDAFARGVAATGKWLRTNASLVQYAVLAIVVGGIGYGVYYWRTSTAAEGATSTFVAGVTADRGHVDPDAKPPKPDEEEDAPTFKTADERANAALTAYRKVETEASGSGTAILAKLGEAGILLDQHKWDDALAAYRTVKASPLAAADADVRGRAMEGAAFALEGKGDRDGALKAFKEIETAQVKGFIELSQYHQARLLWKKGDKEASLAMIKAANERLKTSDASRSFAYLKGVLEDLHRQVDPASAPKKSALGGGPDKQMSMEELQRLQEQIQKQIEKSSQGH